MMKGQKSKLIRICIGAFLFAVLLILRYGGVLYRVEALWVRTALTAALSFSAFLLAGIDVMLHASDCITKGRLLESPVLLTLSCLLLFAIGDYTEATGVMLLYASGDLFAGMLSSGIMKRALPEKSVFPAEVFVHRGNDFVRLDIDEAVPGDLFLVGASETVPLDGTVEEGASEGDLSMLTGGSDPVRIRKGSCVVSGLSNGRGPLIVRAEKTAADSTLQKLFKRLREASAHPCRTERVSKRLSVILSALFLSLAVLISVLPPVLSGGGFPEWIRRGCAVLSAACPLISAFAVPLCFFAGTGSLARNGIYPSGHESVEKLACDMDAGQPGVLEKCGLVLMADDPERIEKAGSIARKTFKTARLCLSIGLAAEVTAAILGITGLLSAGPVLLITVLWSVAAVLAVHFFLRSS